MTIMQELHRSLTFNITNSISRAKRIRRDRRCMIPFFKRLLEERQQQQHQHQARVLLNTGSTSDDKNSFSESLSLPSPSNSSSFFRTNFDSLHCSAFHHHHHHHQQQQQHRSRGSQHCYTRYFSSSSISSSSVTPFTSDTIDDDWTEYNPTAASATTTTADPSTKSYKIIHGPNLVFEMGKVAYLAESAVMGSSGDTVALTTVAVSPIENTENNHDQDDANPGADHDSEDSQLTSDGRRVKMMRRALYKKCQQESSSQVAPLTVDYRQRHHAVGKIPSTASRTDNRRPTVTETLASRAIDRALRPLLTKDVDDGGGKRIHLNCSIQSCPVYDNGGDDDDDEDIIRGGHPIALALNSASFALGGRLTEPVAAVFLRLLEDGTIVANSSITPSSSSALDRTTATPFTDLEPTKATSHGELLYAGTRNAVVMMEFSGYVEEEELKALLEVAHSTIQPILDILERCRDSPDDERTEMDLVDDNLLRAQLGLERLDNGNRSASRARRTSSIEEKDEEEARNRSSLIYDEALSFCRQKLELAGKRLFGCTNEDLEGDNIFPGVQKEDVVTIHDETAYGPLLRKSLRGRREHLFREEIKRLLMESFVPSNTSLAQEYDLIVRGGRNSVSSELLSLADAIHSKLLREAMQQAAIKHSRRSDGRGGISQDGCKVIRPLSIDVPALPNVVHGSALFGRGETQVLVTTTLGSPRDTMPVLDPFQAASNHQSLNNKPIEPDHNLPVGSLRYLKSSGSQYIEADLNTRRIMADREQTGDSGTLKERRRAYLQYDFPAYSKGEVQSGPSSASRREIGHGALAEKAILPILPPVHSFPYAIRITSEVTSSNGSSSMASVCGATLSLLDAGVPILAPAAGVSIGAVFDEKDGSHVLMVDLTGTEDHYGVMDFKIAGTSSSVTGFQLDVKRPLPLSLVVEALNLAKVSRTVILKEMEEQCNRSSNGDVNGLCPRSELKSSAPRVEVVRFSPERKKDLLGPGGVVARQMEDRFDVSMDLTQEGQCLLFGDDKEMVKRAKNAVMDLVSNVEVGLTYEGTVIEIKDFGIIVELLRNKEGLCHVSELADKEAIRSHPKGPFGLINDLIKIGQKLEVVVTAVDPVQGSVKLSPVSKPLRKRIAS